MTRGRCETTDLTDGFAEGVREACRDVPVEDIIAGQLLRMGPTHPALLTRLRDLGETDVAFVPASTPALGRLVADPSAITTRIIELLRPRDPRGEHLTLNPPRVTAGAIGWLIVGVVFAVIFAVRLIGQSAASADIVPIVVVVAALWMLFPIIYPWLQREAIVDQGGIRIRPWWWRWLDPSAERFAWSRIGWSDELRMRVGSEAFVRLTDGTTTLRWWAGLWPKAERARLYDALRERGVAVAFESTVGEKDPARHAVVYHLPDRFLLPEVRLDPDVGLIETTKVKSIGINPFKLGFALIDRLHDQVEPMGDRDEEGSLDQLASIARLERRDFDARVQRVVIDGSVSTWTVEVDGRLAWTGPRAAVADDDMDEAVFDVLGLDYALRQPKAKEPDR